MRKHVRQTKRALGLREPPPWVETQKKFRPKWNCPTEPEQRAFAQFIFSEVDRRIGAEVDAMAAEIQAPENVKLLGDLIQSGLRPAPPKRDGRTVDPVVRRLRPNEQAARLTMTIREIFEDYWDRWNRGRPSAEELAAAYVGTRAGQVATRKKRALARRPSK